jgi:small ubiquitin-related modifier
METQPDVKPQANDLGVLITVRGQDGNAMKFKVKPNTTISKVMDAYCSSNGLNQTSVRFLFDGMRLNREQTVKSLGLQNEDVIDVVLEQTGGSILFF